MKLSLRDLFWLALFVASVTFWWNEHRRAAIEIREWRLRSLLVRVEQLFQPSTAERQRLAAVKKLTAFTDEQLAEHFDAQAATGEYHHAAEYEPCLAEMIRRGMSVELQKYYDELMTNGHKSDKHSWVHFPNNIELLTARRRSQGKPDPLRIDVELLERWPYGDKESAPTVRATVTNVDAGREAVFFWDGGDDRGGRRERWRFMLTDEFNRRVADSNFLSMSGGGVASVGPLEFGKSGGRTNVFDMRRYVAPPRSGKYKLQVFYHNEVSIANEQDLTGLIVSKSDSIWVNVDNVDQLNSARFRMAPHPAIAILIGGGLLLAMSIVRYTSRPKTPSANEADAPRTIGSAWKIARRDLGWAALIATIAFGFWLDYDFQTWQLNRLVPDANAKWTISLASAPRSHGANDR